MRTRNLGKTGLQISELSLGTWGLSGDAYGKIDEADAERVIARAVDIGVTLIDTCDAYAAGGTEAMLGRVLAPYSNVKIALRGGIDRTTEPPRKRFDASLRDSVERSLRRLKREAIDIYMLHNPTVECISKDDTAAILDILKREGKILHWGVSVGNAEVARAAIQQGAAVISLAYNLFYSVHLHRLAGEVMVAGTGVLAHSTLAYGLLAGMWSKDREFSEGDHRKLRWTKEDLGRRIDQLDSIRFLVRGDALTLRSAAVRFVLANHLVSSAILGPRSIQQLEQMIREVGSGPRYLPDEDLTALPRALDQVGIPS